MLHKKKDLKNLTKEEKVLDSTYATRYMTEGIPKYEMPKNQMPPDAAYQLIHDELNLDGNPPQNLASFVTTWMEPNAEKLIKETINKNFIDHDEYPQTEIIHERCVNMLARLFNAPEKGNAPGTATIGSSEAIMLGLLAHKWNWKNRMKKAKKDYSKPNIVFGSDVHVCWEKFARYFEVEMRMVPIKKGKWTTNAKDVEPFIDENTICVGVIVGTTYTGQADDVKAINDMLLKIKKQKGWDIPIHVDGASGGMVAPFVYPELLWDFRLEQVKSINVSGHKYGLTYPGLGWVIFRDETVIPDDIVFTVDYLGGEMPTYTLNFSRGGAMVIAQYYNFLRLGFEGYKRIMENCVGNAKYLAKKLMSTGKFESLNPTQLLPIVAFRLKKSQKWDLYELAAKMRQRGWIIPAYALPPDAEDVVIMRVVVKENFSRDMADMLYDDFVNAMDALNKTGSKKKPAAKKGSKKHKIC
ncbi:MAG: glutamate decarboxylase [Patescibacteria group bacterium]|nr:glutamate decarboxylase [Patescibacteria group bacterium]